MKVSIINLVLHKMAEGYAEQLLLYENMKLIALEQGNCLSVEEINIDEIIKNINSRQELINTLDDLNKDIFKLKAEVCESIGIGTFNISAIRGIIPGPGVDELEKILARIALVLEEIKILDKKNEENLRLCIGETKDKISKIQGSKKANKAYQTAPANKEGVFIDYTK